MNYNPLYRVIIYRINNFLELLGIPLPVINLTEYHIEVKNFCYNIFRLPLDNICIDTNGDFRLIYYHLFNAVWKNFFHVHKIPGYDYSEIKSIYLDNNKTTVHQYNGYCHIGDYEINSLLGLERNKYYRVKETVAALHSNMIEYYILINYIASEFLVSDVSFALHYYVTEIFLNY